MPCSLPRSIALALILCGMAGAAHAGYTAPPLPDPIYHDLGVIGADKVLSVDIVTGGENFTSKTDRYDVFRFSMDYPKVVNFKAVVDKAHDYGKNENGVVEYAWGLMGDDDPAKPTLYPMFSDLGSCDGRPVNGATCSSDGSFGALITNYRLALPAIEGAMPGETYWVGIRNYADYTTYTVSMVAAPVPEPETYAMLLAGLGLTGAIARRRRQIQ